MLNLKINVFETHISMVISLRNEHFNFYKIVCPKSVSSEKSSLYQDIYCPFNIMYDKPCLVDLTYACFEYCYEVMFCFYYVLIVFVNCVKLIRIFLAVVKIAYLTKYAEVLNSFFIDTSVIFFINEKKVLTIPFYGQLPV